MSSTPWNPEKERRLMAAEAAVYAHEMTANSAAPMPPLDDKDQPAYIDTIADILHLAKSNGLNADCVLSLAYTTFTFERKKEEENESKK
jgi:hypothetical protein